MSSDYCGFVDVGYLRGQGSKARGIPRDQTQVQAQPCIDWLRDALPAQTQTLRGLSFLRAYWYDGAFDPEHEHAGQQRRTLDAIGFTPGVQLRLGHLVERHTNRLQRPIEQALRSTASDLNIDPARLLDTFNRHWTWRAERTQKMACDGDLPSSGA